VGEFSYAYNLLDAINLHNGANYLTDFKDPYNSSTNPDPALLDFFTYDITSNTNPGGARSGIVNLNTRQPPVLAAILKGAIFNKNNNDANYTSGVVGLPGVNTPGANLDATNAANDIVNAAATTHAFSRADIARLASAVTTSPFTNDEEARDTIARALLAAADIVREGQLRALQTERYQSWGSELGRRIDGGEFTLSALADYAAEQGFDPRPRSGRQELAESIIARHCKY